MGNGNMADIPVAFLPGTERLILTNPLWGISQASPEQLQTVAALVRAFPDCFLYRQVEEALELFLTHQETEPSDYGKKIMCILSLVKQEVEDWRQFFHLNRLTDRPFFQKQMKIMEEWLAQHA